MKVLLWLGVWVGLSLLAGWAWYELKKRGRPFIEWDRE